MKPYEHLDYAQKRSLLERQEMALNSGLPELDRRSKWRAVLDPSETRQYWTQRRAWPGREYGSTPK